MPVLDLGKMETEIQTCHAYNNMEVMDHLDSKSLGDILFKRVWENNRRKGVGDGK